MAQRRTARSTVDVILGEASSPKEYHDIASVVANRMKATGMTAEQVVAEGKGRQFNAYGKRMPAGVDTAANRSAAQAALQRAMAGDVSTSATFYAMPTQVQNLPKSVTKAGPVHSVKGGHQYFDGLLGGAKDVVGGIMNKTAAVGGLIKNVFSPTPELREPGAWRTTPGSRVEKIDPRLRDIMEKAAVQFNAETSFKVEGFSGKKSRSTGTVNHPRGWGVDVNIYDDQGKKLPNEKDRGTFPVYQKYAQIAQEIQKRDYPDLNGKFSWGGVYQQGTSFDLMHFDIGGTRGAFGSIEDGLNDLGKAAIAQYPSSEVRPFQSQQTLQVARDVPTPTARPAQPGDIDPFSDTTYSPEAEAAPSGGLRPGFTGSSLAPSFTAPGPGTIGGLLGRPSEGFGFMPGSGALAPTTTATPSARPPQAVDMNRPDLSAFQQPTPGLGGLIGGPRPGQETASLTPDLNKTMVSTPGLLGRSTATAEPSSLPDRGPTLADRAVRESITSALPDQGPTLADRPNAARTVTAAQPATPDVVDVLADEDTDAVVSTGAKTAVAKLGTSEATGAGTTDTGLDASPDGQLDVEPLDKGTYPPKPDVFNPGPTKGLFNYGAGLAAKKAATGLLSGGLPGALFGGLGSLISQNMPSGFNEAVPESSRFSVGSGLSGINAALSGPKGATATSRTQKGASVTSLGNGQSLRRSDRFGWTEVVGPDGSVVGIQYDHPQTKGLLGRMSNWAGSTFGGSNGLSPSASRAIRDGTDGGLY